jgi:ribosome modulation factor
VIFLAALSLCSFDILASISIVYLYILTFCLCSVSLGIEMTWRRYKEALDCVHTIGYKCGINGRTVLSCIPFSSRQQLHCCYYITCEGLLIYELGCYVTKTSHLCILVVEDSLYVVLPGILSRLFVSQSRGSTGCLHGKFGEVSFCSP